MSITVKVNGGPSATVAYTSNMNAQQALEGAYAAINNDKQFTYGLQYYGLTFGYLVFMINGTFDSNMPSAAPYYYWEFFVNGIPATKGIDNTILKDRDVVSFAFNVYTPGPSASPMLTAKHEHATKPKV